MADIAHPAGDSDVLVTLVATGHTQAGIPERTIVLTRIEPTVRIGRSSKVAAKACSAAENNAWFETPVMSRAHAELTADFDIKTIALKDVGSLHGSFVRHKATPQTEEPVKAHTSVLLSSGDQIRFGMDIHRHHETYPPCVVDFKSTWRNFPEQAKKSPNTFSVPCGSDDEDPASDTDSVLLIDQDLPAIPTIDLTTEGAASSRPIAASSPSRIIDLTAEAVSVTGRYSPLPSSRRSLSTSPAPHTEPLPVMAGSRTAEWTDIESEDDTSSQASENPEDHPFMDEDEEDMAGYTSFSEETSDDNISDDSMSDSEMGSYDEDSDEDDEVDSHIYDWEATRTFGLPMNVVQDTPAPKEHDADGFDHEMVTESDEESVFDETSPASIWDKKSSPFADPHESLGWSTSKPMSEMQHGCITYPQYVPLRQPSPSDAAMVKSTPAVEGSSSSATAQALGTKTGKFEYFEARDHNRSLVLPSAPALMADLLPLPSYPAHEAVTGFYSTAWTGDDFINRPHPIQQLESLEDRTRLQSPEPLDMTSAFAYQQSKSELRVASPDVRRIPIPDLLAEESKEPSPASPEISNIVVEPSARPPKRGIDEISEDVEEAPVMPVKVLERYVEAQPTKRRRIVEFAACVTLGGAAVLAGLITTAPQFA